MSKLKTSTSNKTRIVKTMLKPKNLARAAVGVGAGYVAVRSLVSKHKTGDPTAWVPAPTIDSIGMARKAAEAMNNVNAVYEYLDCDGRKIPLLVLTPRYIPMGAPRCGAPIVLWLHGGGYILGMKEMALFSRAYDLVERFGCTVVAPDYRLAPMNPFPAALEDCYEALKWTAANAKRLGANPDQLMVGGESAGGGLTAALCMMARDKGEVSICFQMPLYPMLDNLDTETSANNHGKVWNTQKNHLGWKAYLGAQAADPDVDPYAAPARQTNFEGLPPAYTFVGTGEPFYAETIAFFNKLREAGVEAVVDEYETDVHAFDMVQPESETALTAAGVFRDRFSLAMDQCFAAQPCR